MRALLTTAIVLMASVNANWRVGRLQQVLDTTKKLVIEKAAEQVHQSMTLAIEQEVDWQLYKNWKLKLPASQKDAIKTLALRDTAPWVQQTKELFVNHFDTLASREVSQIFTPIANKWVYEQPSNEEMEAEIGQAVLALQARLSPVDVQHYLKQGKEIVRMYFHDHFGQDDYKVSIWQRIKDLSGKGKVSDTDVPIIDNLQPGELPRDWQNLSEEQRKEELKKLFPNLFEVSLMQLQVIPAQVYQVPQSQQLLLVI